jgi:photosystem II stability/assembly factor-like uncharacterized protein
MSIKWEKSESIRTGIPSFWTSCDCDSSGLKVAATAEGEGELIETLFISSNGGIGWDVVYPSEEGFFCKEVKVSSDSLTMFVRCQETDTNYMHLYISKDGGVVWEETIPKVGSEWRHINMSKDGNIFIVDDANEVYISYDGCETWEELTPILTAQYFDKIAINEDGSIILIEATIDESLVLLLSIDSGGTWKTMAVVESSIYQYCGFVINGDGLIMLVDLKLNPSTRSLYISKDKGNTWNEITDLLAPPAGTEQPSMININLDGTKIIVGHYNAFSVSRDGGDNWIVASPVGIDYNFDQGCVATNDDGKKFYAGTWLYSAPSDLRYKTNIIPILSAIEKINKLKGVYFNWKRKEFPNKNFNDKRQIGFIAQNVEKVFPELVHTDSRGYKSIEYDKFTAVLIQAVKELYKEIKLLKKRK